MAEKETNIVPDDQVRDYCLYLQQMKPLEEQRRDTPASA